MIRSSCMVEREAQHHPAREAELGEARGTRILLAMFDLIQATTHRSERECFNQLVRFWGDCLCIHPMLEADHDVADRLTACAESFLDECVDSKADFLGEVFLRRVCSGDYASLLLPSEASVRHANDVVMSAVPNDEIRWGTVLDPSAGTGRFLIDLAVRYPQRRIALFGVEPDLDLYRACMLNMRLCAWNRPYFILCADSEIVDVRPNGSSWLYANVWNPPNWALAQGGPISGTAVSAG
jgi:hypothetical protein